MRKGQIFTLDVLLAVVAVTVVLGYMTWQLELINSKAYDLEFNKVQSLADDFSQIAVKNILAEKNKPNFIDVTKFADLKTEMDSVIVSPYSYEVSLGTDFINQNACDGKANVAVTRRLTNQGELSVKVCV